MNRIINRLLDKDFLDKNLNKQASIENEITRLANNIKRQNDDNMHDAKLALFEKLLIELPGYDDISTDDLVQALDRDASIWNDETNYEAELNRVLQKAKAVIEREFKK